MDMTFASKTRAGRRTRRAAAGAVVLCLIPAWAPARAQSTRPTTSPLTSGMPALAVPADGPAQSGAAPGQTASGAGLQITMAQAVQMALEANLGLKASRLDVDIQAQNLAAARASFLPRTTTNFSRNSSSAPAQLNPDGTTAVTSTTSLSTTTGLQQLLPWYGANYSVQWDARRRETPGSLATFNPSLSSTFSFAINQPLWGGLKIDQARANLESNERLQLITDLRVRQAVVQTEAAVKGAYLDLIAARENQKVTQENLALTEGALANTRARVEVGVSPRTDILADEASVARSRVSVIAAEARIAQAEDQLRRLILDPNRPDYWSVMLVPTDTIELQPRDLNLDQMIRDALANRIDLAILRRNMELTDLNLRVSLDATRPDLSLNLAYAASGTGGRSTAASLADRGIGSVLGEAFGGDYPSWTTSVQFSYPLGFNAARASFASAQISKQQQQLDLRDTELLVVQQIRNAVRQVENSARQVDAARAALASSQQNLEAENRRFAVGLSTNLDLQFRQQALADARLTELNSVISYNRALIELDRVQRVR